MQRNINKSVREWPITGHKMLWSHLQLKCVQISIDSFAAQNIQIEPKCHHYEACHLEKAPTVISCLDQFVFLGRV